MDTWLRGVHHMAGDWRERHLEQTRHKRPFTTHHTTLTFTETTQGKDKTRQNERDRLNPGRTVR